MKNKAKILALLFMLSALISINTSGDVRSQVAALPPVEDIVVSKSASPSTQLQPGDLINVEIRIPGGSENLRNAADTMLIMDISGSMTSGVFLGATKIEAAIDAMNLFVDQVQEDTGPGGPGDFVGLVTYTTHLGIGADLDSPIANMTSAAQTVLRSNIDAMCLVGSSYDCHGGTPIGAGLLLAKEELFNETEPASTAREPDEANKFIVLATDGQHNALPSPYAAGTMDEIIDRGVIVFTVGIGSGVETVRAFDDCPGCPDINGDTRTSGEELMQSISCDTDEDCNKTWDTSNICDTAKTDIPGAVNDYDCPDHYYFADDPAALEKAYQDIAGAISAEAAYQLVDTVNLYGCEDTDGDGTFIEDCQPQRVFDGIIGPINVVDCGSGTPWPDTEFVYPNPTPAGPYSVMIIQVRNVSEGKDVCFRFQIRVAATAVSGNFPIDQIGLTAVWDPEEFCEGTTIQQLLQCFGIMQTLPNIFIDNFWVEIVVEEPWMMTTGGDVGAWANIFMERGIPFSEPAPPNPLSEYLLISQGTQTVRSGSALGWLIPSYNPLNIDPTPTPNPIDLTNIYDPLLDRYSADCFQNLPSASPGPGQISNDIDNICNTLGMNGSVEITGSWGDSNPYTGNPGVIFVRDKLTIKRNMRIAADTGLIWVVQGDIEVRDNVTNIDGIFITNGTFDTNLPTRNCNVPKQGSDEPLTINGAVYGFTNTCFTRILGGGRDLDNPAETINFQPRYLYLFREIVGDDITIYREVAP